MRTSLEWIWSGAWDEMLEALGWRRGEGRREMEGDRRWGRRKERGEREKEREKSVRKREEKRRARDMQIFIIIVYMYLSSNSPRRSLMISITEPCVGTTHYNYNTT